MLLSKLKIRSKLQVDSENSIQKIDLFIKDKHIEINNIRDDEPLSNYINEDLVLNLLGFH